VADAGDKIGARMGAGTGPPVSPDPGSRAAQGGLAVAWRATWTSRLVVWAAGLAALAAVGRAAGFRGYDPAGLTDPLGAAGDFLLGPAARWDAAWYLAIADSGYGPDPARAAFFPLYPLLVRAVATPAVLLGAPVPAANLVAGVAVSLAALVAGLWAVHRMAALEVGAERARLAVLLVAVFPTSLFFSAVYSEALFLAASAGSLCAGRLGRWGWAGALGALAAATRNTGVLLVVALALLYLYGPRADRPSVAAPHGSRLRPRHPVRPDAAWLALVPLGLGAYLAYLAAAVGDPLAPFAVGKEWFRHFAGPLGGVWDGAAAAVEGLRSLVLGSHGSQPASAQPTLFVVAVHNVVNFAFLGLAAVALVGVARRLPAAYAAWPLCALAVPLSYPSGPEPLASIPRYLAVLFPLHVWLALHLAERRLARRATLALSLAGLAALSAAFTTWQWVA
jgi:hypothetical protein